jgi:phage head maturation protease
MAGIRAKRYGMSIQFVPVRVDEQSRPGKSAHNPSGIPERTVLEAKLREISITGFPVYKGTSAVLGARHTWPSRGPSSPNGPLAGGAVP